jgi:branched-chain amino acid transport system ATP-binding protein
MSALRIERVCKTYGGLTALNDVSFEVHPGAIFSVIGPNGAGKTTLINCISGFSAPTSGGVSWRGEDITRHPPFRVTAAGISRTFQNAKLWWNMTVLETVSVGFSSRPGAHRHFDGVPALLDFVGLTSYADAFASELSYGDQRRLDLARALATGPSLLLLDEPAAGMNEKESEGLMGILRELRRIGCAIVMIEHDMPVVMGVSDRIMVLNFGIKIAEGTAAEIRANPAVIEAYLGDVELRQDDHAVG